MKVERIHIPPVYSDTRRPRSESGVILENDDAVTFEPDENRRRNDEEKPDEKKQEQEAPLSAEVSLEVSSTAQGAPVEATQNATVEKKPSLNVVV